MQKAALAHLWRNVPLVAKVEIIGEERLVCNCLELFQEVMIRLSKVGNLKLPTYWHCDRRGHRVRLESAVHSHSGQYTGLPVL